MQNRSNWKFEEGTSETGKKTQQLPSWSQSGAMAAAATASIPRGAPFPQPPFGFFQLHGTESNYNIRHHTFPEWGMLR